MGSEAYALATARGIAEEIRDALLPFCKRLVIAGSIRREKSVVGDIELVGQEKEPYSLMYQLDRLAHQNKIQKWDYSKKADRPMYRWGKAYRGFAWGGFKTEIFLTDDDGWGYQLWLRTGPGQANTWVMTQLKQMRSMVRTRDGHVWEVAYPTGWTPENDKRTLRKVHKLCIPKEETMFGLLGMPMLLPADRLRATYARLGIYPVRTVEQVTEYWADEPMYEPEMTTVQGKLL